MNVNMGTESWKRHSFVPACVLLFSPGQWKLCSLLEVFLSPSSPRPHVQGVGVSAGLMRAVAGAGRGRRALATCVSCDWTEVGLRGR